MDLRDIEYFAVIAEHGHLGRAAEALGLGQPALSISLRRLALESRLQGRFPPRNWKTWRDVRVLRDAPALGWAKRVEVAGIAVLCVAVALVAWAAVAWVRFG